MEINERDAPKALSSASKLEVDKYPPEVFIVFFNTVIQLFDMTLIQKSQDFFLELSAAFAWDNFHQCNFSVNSFFNDSIEFFIDLIALVVNIM
jgi:hypothetical protein